MVVYTKDNLNKGFIMIQVNYNGQMVINMMENGKKVEWMVQDVLKEKMVKN